jgi:hypothetical protein
MTCRIDRVDQGENSVVFRVTGRIQSEHVETLRALVARECGRVSLDLAEVTLVDRKVVTFLALCAANGVQILYAPDYLGDWVRKERAEIDQVKNRRKR